MKRSTTKLLTATIFAAMAAQPAFCFSYNPLNWFRKKANPTTIAKAKTIGKCAVSKTTKYGTLGWNLVKNNPFKTAAITTTALTALAGATVVAKSERTKKAWNNHKGKIITGALVAGLSGGYFYAPAAYVGLATSGIASLAAYAPKVLNAFNATVGSIKNLKWLIGGRGIYENPNLTKTEKAPENKANYYEWKQELENLKKEIITEAQKPELERKHNWYLEKEIKQPEKKEVRQPEQPKTATIVEQVTRAAIEKAENNKNKKETTTKKVAFAKSNMQINVANNQKKETVIKQLVTHIASSWLKRDMTTRYRKQSLQQLEKKLQDIKKKRKTTGKRTTKTKKTNRVNRRRSMKNCRGSKCRLK